MQRFKATREAIALAQTPDRVGELLSNCMTNIPNDWLGAMPLMCQHIIEMRTPDIPSAAIDLLRMDMVFTGGSEAGQILREITQTYAAAATRLAKLRA